MKRIVLAIGIIWPVIGSAAGTHVYDFLNIPIGARSVGMGGAFTAVANDPSSVYWNPAGGVNNSIREVSLEYNHYIAGVRRGYLGYLHPLGTRSSLGLGINYLSVGDMIKTNLAGDEEGRFSPFSMATSIAYSTVVLDEPAIIVGAALKGIYESIIDEYSSYGVAGDFGVLYKPGPEEVTIGFSVQNIGSQIREFKEEKESLPLNLALGGSYSLWNDQLLLGLDLKRPSDHGLLFALGSEWIVSEILTLRLGYNSLGSDWKSGSEMDIISGFSFGLGLKWKRLSLDLSTSPMVDLGNPLWISTSYSL